MTEVTFTLNPERRPLGNIGIDWRTDLIQVELRTGTKRDQGRFGGRRGAIQHQLGG